MEDKYIGLALAVTSTLAIGKRYPNVDTGRSCGRHELQTNLSLFACAGSSFVITKKGLNEAAARHGFEGDGFSYLQRPTWWAGIIIMVIGEIANFAAYAFAPAILVTPLGALSVLIGYNAPSAEIRHGTDFADHFVPGPS